MNPLKIKLALAKLLPEMIDVNQNCVDGYRFSWKDGKQQLITSREWLYVVHECEKKLTKEECYIYSDALSLVLGKWERNKAACNWPFHATFDQRAEALLRTLGQWEEE